MEMFPGTTAGDFTVLNGVNGNGGSIDAGDVVSCFHDGRPQLGRLLVALGVHRAGVYESHAIIAIWQPQPESAAVDVSWPMYAVSHDNVIIVLLEQLDTVFIHRMSVDQSSCRVYMPVEVR
jgi:hypothetical protein